MSTKTIQEAIYQRVCDGCEEYITDDEDRLFIHIQDYVKDGEHHYYPPTYLDLHTKCAEPLVNMLNVLNMLGRR